MPPVAAYGVADAAPLLLFQQELCNQLFGQKKAAEKRGEDTADLQAQIDANSAESVRLDQAIADEAEELKTLQGEFRTLMLSLPNLPDPDLKPGARRTTNPCVTSVSPTSLTLSLSTMWICAWIWASSTMSGV